MIKSGMHVNAAIHQANAEFYPPKRKRRPALEVRGEGDGRHTMMMSEIGAMWDGKMDEDEFVERAMLVNEKYCSPPKPEYKIRDQVRWIMRKRPAAQPGPVVFLNRKHSGMSGWITAAMRRK